MVRLVFWVSAGAARVTENQDNSIRLDGLSVPASLFWLAILSMLFSGVFVTGQVSGLHLLIVSQHFLGGSIILATGFLALVWFDLREFRLPDVINAALAFGGLAFVFVSQGAGDAVINAASGVLVLFCILGIALISERILGRRGIGLGDGKLLGAIVCWMGPISLPPVLMIASGLGIFLSVLLQIARNESSLVRNGYLPFGPAICVSAWMFWNLGRIWPFIP